MVLHQIVFPCGSVSIFYFIIASSLGNKFRNHLYLTEVQVLVWQDWWWTSTPQSLWGCSASSARQSRQPGCAGSKLPLSAHWAAGKAGRQALMCMGLELQSRLFVIDLSLVALSGCRHCGVHRRVSSCASRSEGLINTEIMNLHFFFPTFIPSPNYLAGFFCVFVLFSFLPPPSWRCICLSLEITDSRRRIHWLREEIIE